MSEAGAGSWHAYWGGKKQNVLTRSSEEESSPTVSVSKRQNFRKKLNILSRSSRNHQACSNLRAASTFPGLEQVISPAAAK